MLILSFGFSANWFNPRQVLEPPSQQKLSLISGAGTPFKFLSHLSLLHGSLCAVFSGADGQTPVDRFLQGVKRRDAVAELVASQNVRACRSRPVIFGALWCLHCACLVLALYWPSNF